MAPGAQLHSLKVFGEDGSTSDSVILAAMELAADPNGDMDNSDRLDVINLSLGSSWGTEHSLYGEAVKNLARAGIVAVSSAGNAGDSPYIIGSPSSEDEFISVANSIDNMQHNWQYPAATFYGSNEKFIAKFTESEFALAVEDQQNLSTTVLYHLGTAVDELSDEQKDKLAGKFALIDRGDITFVEKVNRAVDGGAVGVVIANNREGEPFVMGGDADPLVPYPVIMISQENGDAIKALMDQGEVSIAFEGAMVEEPNRIDTIGGSSSRGPRSIDGIIKPEIAAPGTLIISASSRSGNEYDTKTGTSMASPHVAGVAALLKQIHPNLPVAQLKSLIVNSATTMFEDKATQTPYPIARQGAGRVQAFEAATSQVAFTPQTLSLGIRESKQFPKIPHKINLKNLTNKRITLGLTPALHPKLYVDMPTMVVLNPKASKTISFTFTVEADTLEEFENELDGFIYVKGGEKAYQIPVLVEARKTSNVSLKKIDTAGTFVLSNKGQHTGKALAFNDLGLDVMNVFAKMHPDLYGPCDLVSAGYRIVTRTDKDENDQETETSILQFAFQLYDSLTDWVFCEPLVLIDADGDGLEEQELVGVSVGDVSGRLAQRVDDEFGSVLLDAHKVRELRSKYEEEADDDTDYYEAVEEVSDFQGFRGSSLAIVEAPIKALALNPEGALTFRLGFLDATTPGKWTSWASTRRAAGSLSTWNRLHSPLIQRPSPWRGMAPPSCITTNRRIPKAPSSSTIHGMAKGYLPLANANT